MTKIRALQKSIQILHGDTNFLARSLIFRLNEASNVFTSLLAT